MANSNCFISIRMIHPKWWWYCRCGSALIIGSLYLPWFLSFADTLAMSSCWKECSKPALAHSVSKQTIYFDSCSIYLKTSRSFVFSKRGFFFDLLKELTHSIVSSWFLNLCWTSSQMHFMDSPRLDGAS